MKVQYYIIYLFAYLHAILPLRVLYFFSDILYVFIYYIAGYRRKITEKNLRQAFPYKTGAELKKTERSFYRHFCDYVFETIKMLHISDDEMKRRFRFINSAVINGALQKGQSCILMLGHYGNWEWVTSITLWVPENPNLEISQIYRPLKNKAFDQFMLDLRKRFRSVGIPKNDTLRHIIKLRQAGKQFLIGFMSDQKPSRNNMHYWTTFLNMETSVLTGAERIAKKTDALVAYLDIKKMKRGFYEAEIKTITENAKKAEEFEITEKYARMMENTVLYDPSYWLWTHNRWKYKKEDIKT